MVAEIPRFDRRGREQAVRLLRAEGLQPDPRLDYLCGVFDGGGELLAVGGAFRGTLRCFAVAAEHRGEGLLDELLSHLVAVEAERGHTRLFLWTKPAAAAFFAGAGFCPVAETPLAVLMENRRGAFDAWLEEVRAACGAADAAAVLHADPFTLGHRYLLERAAAESGRLCVFVLSEEMSPIPFSVRMDLVREGTADLRNVCVLPTGPYLISSATFPGYFLHGPEETVRAQAELDLAVFARIAAALGIRRRYVGEEPFSRTTAAYNRIMAERLPAAGVTLCCLPRLEKDGRPVSASAVRRALRRGRMDEALELVPPCTRRWLLSRGAEPVLSALAAAGAEEEEE